MPGADPEGIQWGCSKPLFWQELFHFHGDLIRNKGKKFIKEVQKSVLKSETVAHNFK